MHRTPARRGWPEALEAPALRIVFFGTPEFALPALDALLASRHPVVAVVSQPDRGRGRGRQRTPSPIAQRALAAGLPLLRPAAVGAPESVDALREFQPDLGVVVAFGQFLPRAIRELPRIGYCINAHASLLPRWRGAAPIVRAILAGDTRSGVSIMRVEREMDAGPVALQAALEIGAEETGGELAQRLAELGGRLLVSAIDAIAAGGVRWCEQSAQGVCFAPKLARDESRLDWREDGAALLRRIRAFAPKPGAFSDLGGEPLRILAARFEPAGSGRAPDAADCGRIERRSPAAIAIACADGWLLPTRVQRAGGRALAVDAYLRGHALPAGARFDAPSARE